MTLKYRVNNLCCANCAAKMERAINKLSGVKEASISFMNLRLTVETDGTVSEEELEKELNSAVKKYERNGSLTKL